MEALRTAANDAIDEEKAKGAALLPKFVPRSDDDRAEEKPAVKSAVGPVRGGRHIAVLNKYSEHYRYSCGLYTVF